MLRNRLRLAEIAALDSSRLQDAPAEAENAAASSAGADWFAVRLRSIRGAARVEAGRRRRLVAGAVPAAFVVGFILLDRGVLFPWHVSAGSFADVVWRETRELTLEGLLLVVTFALIVLVAVLTDALSARLAVAAFVGVLVGLWLLLRLVGRRR